MAWTEQLEQAASAGKPLPDGLTGPEKMLYVTMRGLYWQYRNGVIELDQAKKEKAALLSDFREAELREKAWERSIKAWRWVDLSLNKCECPECIALKRAILQLENIM